MSVPLPPQELAELFEQTKRLVRSTLFTVLDWNGSEESFARLFSSRPDLSRPGVIKDGTVSRDWRERCIDRQESCLGVDRSHLAATYSEWRELVTAGCGSAMNVPVVGADGSTVGIVNAFAGERVYDLRSLRQFEQLIHRRRPELAEAIVGAGNELRRSLSR